MTGRCCCHQYCCSSWASFVRDVGDQDVVAIPVAVLTNDVLNDDVVFVTDVVDAADQFYVVDVVDHLRPFDVVEVDP